MIGQLNDPATSVGAVGNRRNWFTNSPPERQTMTITELARILGISRTTCYELAHQRKLPVRVVKIGRRLLVSRAEVRRFLEGSVEAAAGEVPATD